MTPKNNFLEFWFLNKFKIFYPDYKKKNYFQIELNELLLRKSDDTINLLCKK